MKKLFTSLKKPLGLILQLIFGIASTILSIVILFILIELVGMTYRGLAHEEKLTRKYIKEKYYGFQVRGPVNTDSLAHYIQERSKEIVVIGAICKDGWKSNATGRGACSHHGGVKEWIYVVKPMKTIEECLLEADISIKECKSRALKQSWID
ncbi:MAG: hypothetical protein V2A67_08075 [Bacteroidota bacterium]